jgi:hypothetical protein
MNGVRQSDFLLRRRPVARPEPVPVKYSKFFVSKLHVSRLGLVWMVRDRIFTDRALALSVRPPFA